MKNKIVTTLLLFCTSLTLHPYSVVREIAHNRFIDCSAVISTEIAIQKLKISPKIAVCLRTITYLGITDLAIMTQLASTKRHEGHAQKRVIFKSLIAGLSTLINYAYNNSQQFQKAVNSVGLGEFVQKLDLQTLNAITTISSAPDIAVGGFILATHKP